MLLFFIIFAVFIIAAKPLRYHLLIFLSAFFFAFAIISVRWLISPLPMPPLLISFLSAAISFAFRH